MKPHANLKLPAVLKLTHTRVQTQSMADTAEKDFEALEMRLPPASASSGESHGTDILKMQRFADVPGTNFWTRRY